MNFDMNNTWNYQELACYWPNLCSNINKMLHLHFELKIKMTNQHKEVDYWNNLLKKMSIRIASIYRPQSHQ
jgi:hypothetical protein